MKHIDAIGHVRGTSVYLDDLPEQEGTLHVAVFGSPLAHGHVSRLDVSAARSCPGVVAVFTAQDIPGQNQIGSIIMDEPLLAESLVDYQGQPMALIAATSEEHARAALSAIVVEIDPLPVTICPRAAKAAGSLIAPPRTFQIGDVDQAWSQCSHIVSGQASSGGQEHLYIECQGAYAMLNEGGHLKLYSSTQGPTAVQKITARVLGLAMHQVEVDVTRLGGGFGGKEDQATPWACMAALVCFLTRRPAKLVLHRLDDIRMTGKRHPYSSDYRIGLGPDLKILAYEATFYQNAGSSADLSTAILERTLFHHNNCYFLPNARATAISCKTNLPSNTAFRGFGGPQGMFVIESAIAHAAETLGVAAWQIQQANLIASGDTFPYGQRLKQDHAQKAWSKLLEAGKFQAVQAEVESFNKNHPLEKQGLAIMPICFGISFTNKALNQASALLHLYQDGSVSLSTAAVEMGQGVNTKMIQVAAACLGISTQRIRVEPTNTSRVANTSPTAASSGADLNGKAVEKAASGLLARLKAFAAVQIGRPDAVITLTNERVYADDVATDLNWTTLVHQAYWNRISLTEQAFYATPEIHFDKTREKGHPFAYHVFGAALFRVRLDCLRGRYQFDQIDVVHDYGDSINPSIDLGQVEGGLVQGMGWVTMEEVLFNQDGRCISNALSTYKVPDIYSTPAVLNVTPLGEPGSEHAIFRGKAVGEPPLMYGIGAYFAIRNAIRAFNKDATLAFDAPFTPEKVLMGLYQSTDQEAASRSEPATNHCSF